MNSGQSVFKFELSDLYAELFRAVENLNCQGTESALLCVDIKEETVKIKNVYRCISIILMHICKNGSANDLSGEFILHLGSFRVTENGRNQQFMIKKIDHDVYLKALRDFVFIEWDMDISQVCH